VAVGEAEESMRADEICYKPVVVSFSLSHAEMGRAFSLRPGANEKQRFTDDMNLSAAIRDVMRAANGVMRTRFPPGTIAVPHRGCPSATAGPSACAVRREECLWLGSGCHGDVFENTSNRAHEWRRSIARTLQTAPVLAVQLAKVWKWVEDTFFDAVVSQCVVEFGRCVYQFTVWVRADRAEAAATVLKNMVKTGYFREQGGGVGQKEALEQLARTWNVATMPGAELRCIPKSQVL